MKDTKLNQTLETYFAQENAQERYIKSLEWWVGILAALCIILAVATYILAAGAITTGI